MIGILATVLVQSSSTSTSIIITMVAADCEFNELRFENDVRKSACFITSLIIKTSAQSPLVSDNKCFASVIHCNFCDWVIARCIWSYLDAPYARARCAWVRRDVRWVESCLLCAAFYSQSHESLLATGRLCGPLKQLNVMSKYCSTRIRLQPALSAQKVVPQFLDPQDFSHCRIARRKRLIPKVILSLKVIVHDDTQLHVHSTNV